MRFGQWVSCRDQCLPAIGQHPRASPTDSGQGPPSASRVRAVEERGERWGGGRIAEHPELVVYRSVEGDPAPIRSIICCIAPTSFTLQALAATIAASTSSPSRLRSCCRPGSEPCQQPGRSVTISRPAAHDRYHRFNQFIGVSIDERRSADRSQQTPLVLASGVDGAEQQAESVFRIDFR